MNTRTNPDDNFYFDYREDSEYGQYLMEISAMIAELMDPMQVYNRIDVREKLIEIEGAVARLRRAHFSPKVNE